MDDPVGIQAIPPLGRDGGRAEPYLTGDVAAAPYGSTLPRLRDHLVRLSCRVMAGLWRAMGLRHAAGMLRHYAGGTGLPYRADAASLMAVPAAQEAVAEQLARWRAEALQRWAEEGRGEKIYRADSGWRSLVIDRAASLDWWLALRGLSYRLAGTAHVGSDGTVTVDHRFQVHKSWNFDHGEAEYGIPFSPFARLHEAGIAREYEVIGEVDGLSFTRPVPGAAAGRRAADPAPTVRSPSHPS
ncbi:hypothetical protein G5C51_05145 [Streptomyces sp. A7024]|uniref:Uncharacterized protein n=1 Tax=Streptomyces coryli TaxID=1128680 RepID=A0A6G4TU38_9ACTN|nr:hypothetical protein [Streptomyces coryli]NGN63292.1 hypothetical protein [Streptomyces coryli]